MKRRVRFDSAAELELNEAADYYDLESPGLGSVFLDEVDRALAQVTEFPDAATPVHVGVRKRLLTKVPVHAALLAARRRDPHLGRRPSEASAVLLARS